MIPSRKSVVKSTPRPANRRQQILEAATVLFAGQGYQTTSIRQIADACDITEAAIYRHFDGKEQLYTSVIAAKAEQHDIEDVLATKAGQGSIEDALQAVAEHILGLAETDPGLIRLMFRNTVQTGPVTTVLFERIRMPYIAFLSRELRERKATGEIREVDDFITARCFVGMVMDCALNAGMWSQVKEPEYAAKNVICNNVPIFARGLLREDASD